MPPSGYSMGEHIFRVYRIDARAFLEPRYLSQLLFLFLAYVATALWGLSLQPVNGFATLVWPPTGIALATLFLFGYRLWPAVVLGALLTNLVTGAPPAVALGIGVGNGLEALVGAYLLRNMAKLNPLFRRLQDSMSFIAIAVAAPVISATIGVGSLVLGGIIQPSAFAITWTAWWLGDVLGALVFGAFLVRWLAKPFFRRSRLQVLEGAAAFSLLIASNIIAILNPLPLLSGLPTVYFFVPFLWLSIRGGARGITAASLITGSFITWSTLTGGGVFAHYSSPENLFLAQLLIGILATIFLIIASVMEERRAANAALQTNVDELRRALGKIKKADQAKGEFLAVLAHELRNPLAPLLSSLELFRMEGFSSPEKRRLGEKMEHSISTMMQLLDDLLDVSRVSQKNFKLEKTSVNIGAVVQRSLESVEALMNRRGHTATLSLPEEVLWVGGDPLRLEQIIVNLLNNAAKYTEPGGNVSVSCTVEKKRVVIEVRDTGIGIPAERFPHLFEPFQQGPRVAGSRPEGIGVGLSLAKKLVRLHGGEIEAMSAGVGLGSTFTIYLPLSLPTPLPSAPPKIAVPVRQTIAAAVPPKILVVDDNAAAAAALCKLLELTGYETRVAHTGKSALKATRRFEPDIALVDVGLPDIDGYAVARELRARDFRGTLIALTGYGQDEDKVKAFAAGFDQYLIKPAGIADIRAALEKDRTR